MTTHLAIDDDALAVELSHLRGLIYLLDSTIHDHLDGRDLDQQARRAVISALLALATAFDDRLTRISVITNAGQLVDLKRESAQ